MIPFSLLIDGPDGRLPVLDFRGSEAMNRLYRFDIRVSVAIADAAGFTARALESRTTLEMLDDGRPVRLIHGVVLAARNDRTLQSGRVIFTIRLGPRLSLLKLRRANRIFQNLDAREIIDRILDLRSLDRNWQLERKPTTRTYCVQRHDTDLAFVTRLCAEEGLMFAFEHPSTSQGEIVTFFDNAQTRPVDGGAHFTSRGWSEETALEYGEAHVGRFSTRRAARSEGVVHRAYDLESPERQHLDAASVGGAPRVESSTSMRTMVDRTLTIYEHVSAHEQALPETAAAQRHLDGVRARATVGSGESTCRRLLPGRHLTLSNHELGENDGQYTITRVEHRGYAPEHAAPGKTIYSNRFACVPSDVAFRPRPASRRRRQGTETAIVVGPHGKEIFTDELGRIKVQFHWDLEGKADEHSSCWLRVAQAWAGAGFGTQFVPRVGMEVLVTFIEGDPDRPVVTGCLYNGTHPSPFSTTTEQTRSGIRTQSSPGGKGAHELVFEDLASAEFLAIRSKRDLVLAAPGHHRVEVDGDVRHSTGGQREIATLGDAIESVGGNHTRGVAGAYEEDIGGKWSSSVGGTRVVAVDGDSHTRLAQNHTVHVGGFSEVLLGAASESSYASVVSRGPVHLTSAESIDLRAQKRIDLSVGSTRLRIDEAGVHITCGLLKISSAQTNIATPDGKGAIGFAGALSIHADSLTLTSAGASLVLDAEAKLDGSLVKLNCGSSSGSGEVLGTESEHANATFTVEDYDPSQGEVVLVILTPEGERIERTVDGTGTVRLEGRTGGRFTVVEVRKNGVAVAAHSPDDTTGEDA